MIFDTYRVAASAESPISLRSSPRWAGRSMSPAQLDRWADIELAHGRVARAEQLAHRAAELRLTDTATPAVEGHTSDGLSMADVYARISKVCRDIGGQRAFAGRVGCSEAMISQVLNAKTPPSDRILKAAGLKRVLKIVEA